MESIQNRVSIATADSGAAKVVIHYTLRALMWLIVATAMLVWLLIGFFFWIPLLVRAAIGFSVEVVNATLTGRSADAAGKMLQRAVNFYRSGFVNALEAIQEPSEQPRRIDVVAEEDEVGIDARGFINEVGWTLLIWYLIASFLGWTSWTPVRAWNEFWAIEWGQSLGILWYSFKTWIAGFSLF
ncbi:MAG: hypothetical protein OEO23_06250 [Gemmatimonadota bacterium]|nr:hypothetical protein [Gemmatimonadota bacterium]